MADLSHANLLAKSRRYFGPTVPPEVVRQALDGEADPLSLAAARAAVAAYQQDFRISPEPDTFDPDAHLISAEFVHLVQDDANSTIKTDWSFTAEETDVRGSYLTPGALGIYPGDADNGYAAFVQPWSAAFPLLAIGAADGSLLRGDGTAAPDTETWRTPDAPGVAVGIAGADHDLSDAHSAVYGYGAFYAKDGAGQLGGLEAGVIYLTSPDEVVHSITVNNAGALVIA